MEPGKILVSHDEGNYVIKLEGDVRLTLCTSLSQYMETIFLSDHVDDVIVDLLDAEGVDSTTLGLMAKLAIYCKENFAIKPTVFCVDEGLVQILESMGLDDIYTIVERAPEKFVQFEQLEPAPGEMEQLQKQILEAHKLLVLLKPERRNEFIDLIKSLEEKS